MHVADAHQMADGGRNRREGALGASLVEHSRRLRRPGDAHAKGDKGGGRHRVLIFGGVAAPFLAPHIVGRISSRLRNCPKKAAAATSLGPSRALNAAMRLRMGMADPLRTCPMFGTWRVGGAAVDSELTCPVLVAHQ